MQLLALGGRPRRLSGPVDQRGRQFGDGLGLHALADPARGEGLRHRRRLLDGFERAVAALKVAGSQRVYLDGSFVMAKEFPADYDACWDATGVRIEDLDPVLLDFSRRRNAQKMKYFGELFPAQSQAEAHSPYRTFLDFFQNNKDSGNKKGIIGINIGTIV